MKQKSSLSSGFTLIEIMIVVAIIGILAVIAYPSYTSYVQRSNRAQLKAILLENAQILERFSTEANAYDVDAVGATPAYIDRSPKPGEGTPVYTIVLASNATTFTLTATPVAGARMDGDACGSFTLNHFGQKGLTGNSLGINDCWNK